METYIEYYQISSDNWNKFINQCERALIKTRLCDSTNKKYDWWSASAKFGSGYQTVWEQLSNTGEYQYNRDEIVIDFRFKEIVYAEIKI